MPITFDIAAFSVELEQDVAPEFDGGDALGQLTANSTAVMNVSVDDISGWIKFKTDGFDVDDEIADDVLFKSCADNWAVRHFSNVAIVTVNAAFGSCVDFNSCVTGLSTDTVSYDRVRWMASDLFRHDGSSNAQLDGIYGLDLFSNEEEIRNEIVNMDSNIYDNIISQINLIQDGNMETPTGSNLGKQIVLSTFCSRPERFLTNAMLRANNRDSEGYYNFEFDVGDKIRLKVNYKIPTGDNSFVFDGLGTIENHSYIYELNIVA